MAAISTLVTDIRTATVSPTNQSGTCQYQAIRFALVISVLYFTYNYPLYLSIRVYQLTV